MHLSSALLIRGLFLAMVSTVHAQGVQISGGVDGRFISEGNPTSNELKLEGLFLNFRKVWSDDLGDRWILVGQVDFDDNFQQIRPYQVYLQ